MPIITNQQTAIGLKYLSVLIIPLKNWSTLICIDRHWALIKGVMKNESKNQQPVACENVIPGLVE